MCSVSQIFTVNGDCTLGGEDQLQISPNFQTGLYIDTENPVSCNGTLTQWNLCFYVISGLVMGRSDTHLEIWRFSPGRETLFRVGWYQTTLSIDGPQSQSFQCFADTLEPEQYLSVMQGDLLGLAVYIRPALPVLGSNSPSESASLLHFPLSVFPIPGPSTRTAQSGSILARSEIHVTAEIQGERKIFAIMLDT